MKNFRNILIVRTDRIGDVVLTTPAIKALHQAYPGARISILVAKATTDLVTGNPYLDGVMVDDRQGVHHGLWGFFRLVITLRSKKFDLAVIYHTKRRYNLACFLAGIPLRLGYKNNKFGFLLNRPVKDLRAKGLKHETQYCLELLKNLGIYTNEFDCLVPLQPSAENWIVHWMQENQIHLNACVAIHPAASDPAKCWPAASFSQLIDRLIETRHVKIILIGSGAMQSLSDQIIRQTQHASSIINMTGKTSLAQTVSLLRRCRLLISNDSGPVHVSAALGCHVISLFLRNDPGINPERWRPLGPKSYILGPGSIDVDEVMVLADKIFQKQDQMEIF